jgi:hypothetical protein
MDTCPVVSAFVSALGKDDRFTVFSVREKKRTADLKSTPSPGNPAYLLQDVPWADISYLPDERGSLGGNSKQSPDPAPSVFVRVRP